MIPRCWVATILMSLLAVLIGAGCHRNMARPGADGELQVFWTEFRAAALEGRMTDVEALTVFPFTTRGTLDGSPVRVHEREAFRKMFNDLLATDPGLSAEPSTMRRLIEATVRVEDQQAGGDGATARVGTFGFERIGGRWRFAVAYIEE